MPADLPQDTVKHKIRALLQGNHLPEAKSLCMNLCKQNPQDAEAWFILGAVCERLGQLPEADRYCRKVIKLQPHHAIAHYNHGIVLFRMGKLDKATGCFRRAIQLKPDFAEAYNDLGNTLAAAGRHTQAADAFRQSLKLKPELLPAHIQLGVSLQQAGQTEDAIACHKNTLHRLKELTTTQASANEYRPFLAKLHFHIANIQFDCQAYQDAEINYRKSLQYNPTDAEALNNLGNTLKAMHDVSAAIDSYRSALAISPDYAAAHTNLGVALRDMRQLHDALDSAQMAVQIDKGFAEGFHNLANILQDLHRHSEAEASYLTALGIKPAFADAETGLGNALLSQGRATEAIEHLRRATHIEPDNHEANDCLLFSINYDPEQSPVEIYKQHAQWGKHYRQTIRIPEHQNNPDTDRKLRIGYVSPDFRSHSVAFFLEPLLACHDPDKVDVYCYAEVAHPDEVTHRLQNIASNWRSTVGISDQDVADMICSDGIDILIDLAGHSRDNRLGIFAIKPAPVQITWLGYPNTTGLQAIDYRLTDAHADPEGSADSLNTETLIRLPDTFLCYAPVPDSPDISPPPALSHGHITFGSFNMLAKTTPGIVEHWSQILKQVPGSRLILKTRALQDEGTRKRYHSLFTDHGISTDRVDLVSWTPGIQDHLAYYNRVDIALDTYPYNGTTTTCEALWMGVPVVCLAGESHAGRVGVSLLNTAGIPEMIASSVEEYTHIAVELAGAPERLQEIRTNLRSKIANSPLSDNRTFARNVEHAYMHAWRSWCKQHAKA